MLRVQDHEPLRQRLPATTQQREPLLPPSAMLKQTILTIYTRRWYHGIFYLAADGTVEHGKNAFGVELPETGRPRTHMARLSQARHKAAL